MSAPRTRAQVETALHSRLVDVAAILDPAAVAGDPPTAELVHRLALGLKRNPDPSRAWLLFIAISGSFPASEDVVDLLRRLDLVEPSAVVVAALGATMDAACKLDDPARRLRVVEHATFIDVHFCATHEHNTGIQRVVRETVPRWVAEGRDLDLVAWTSDAAAMRGLDDIERDRVLNWYNRTFPAGTRSASTVDEIVVPWRSRILLAEVPQLPLCNALAALARHSGNEVAAIGYDAIPLVSAEGQSAAESERFAHYLSVVKHARRVVGISDSAAEEFRGFVDVLPSQGLTGPEVVAVPLAVEVPEAARQVKAATRAKPLVLCVGSHEPRKNQDAVLAAGEEVWRRGADFELVFVGGGSRTVTNAFDARVAALSRRGFAVRSLRGLADRELWELYAAARFTVFVSLHEGFGLPVAESLALGAPVLTSNHGATAEVAAGGGCVLVDPRDDDAIAREMERLLLDDELVARLRVEASSRQPRSWDDYASQLWMAAGLGGGVPQ